MTRILRSCLLLLCYPGLGAQSPSSPAASVSGDAAAKLPTYDISTIRINKTSNSNWQTRTQDASFTAENVPLHMLLRNAFDVREKMIFGLPSWAENAHYDISAKVDEPDMAALKKLTGPQHLRMQQILLEQRFSLKWHFESKMLPVYELLVAKEGSRLTPVSPTEKGGVGWSEGDIKATAGNTEALVDILSQALERPVVDKTGLTGTYDYHLKWTPAERASGADNGKDDIAPAIFTAIQEQLGLKLQPGKAPIQTLVIDQIAPPTEN